MSDGIIRLLCWVEYRDVKYWEGYTLQLCIPHLLYYADPSFIGEFHSYQLLPASNPLLYYISLLTILTYILPNPGEK